MSLVKHSRALENRFQHLVLSTGSGISFTYTISVLPYQLIISPSRHFFPLLPRSPSPAFLYPNTERRKKGRPVASHHTVVVGRSKHPSLGSREVGLEAHDLNLNKRDEAGMIKYNYVGRGTSDVVKWGAVGATAWSRTEEEE